MSKMCDAKEELEKSIDIASDAEKELAQTALNEFNKGNYSGCLQNISKLDNRPYDFKVVHNKAVAEFYKSDLKKLDNFQKSLTNMFHQFNMRLEKLDDVDHCAAYFNQALLMYHQRQYTSALRVIDKVYKFIEPMDEILARQVGLLAIELKLCIRQPDKALCLITYLENQILEGNKPAIKPLKLNGKQAEKESKEKKAVVSPLTPAREAFLKKLTMYKIKCYLMSHSPSAEEKIQALLTTDKQNVELLFMHANIEYLKGNFESAVKILTSIPNDCLKFNETGESSTVMFYNNMGTIHHAMGKPNLACHYFKTALKEDMALCCCSSSNKKDGNSDKDKPLYTLGGSKYYEIIYNLGISLLYAGKPQQAFDCLIIAVRRYHRNSRLWLRLAECCISTHKESNEESFDLRRLYKDLVVEYVDNKIVLTSNLSKDKKYSRESQTYAVPVPTIEFASLCLRNALLLLPSDTSSSPVQMMLIPGVTPPDPPPSPGPAPSNPVCPETVSSLRNSILIASAYVCLCVGDYVLALEHAKQLLEQPKMSETHKLLAHLYAAEALVLLDKSAEALEHLNPENVHVKEISFDLPADLTTATDNENEKEKDEKVADGERSFLKTNPSMKWYPKSQESLTSVVQYNVAVIKAIQGQFEQASALLQNVWKMRHNCPVPAHVLMLIIYTELKLGHADTAKSIIRQYAFQHRVNG